jgi:hypothetical protein
MAYPIAGLKNVNGNSRLILGNAIVRFPPANSRQRPVRHLSLVEAESPAQKAAINGIGVGSPPHTATQPHRYFRIATIDARQVPHRTGCRQTKDA